MPPKQRKKCSEEESKFESPRKKVKMEECGAGDAGVMTDTNTGTRRSGRERKPNSMLKDMEVTLMSPQKQAMKKTPKSSPVVKKISTPSAVCDVMPKMKTATKTKNLQSASDAVSGLTKSSPKTVYCSLSERSGSIQVSRSNKKPLVINEDQKKTITIAAPVTEQKPTSVDENSDAKQTINLNQDNESKLKVANVSISAPGKILTSALVGNEKIETTKEPTCTLVKTEGNDTTKEEHVENQNISNQQTTVEAQMERKISDSTEEVESGHAVEVNESPVSWSVFEKEPEEEEEKLDSTKLQESSNVLLDESKASSNLGDVVAENTNSEVLAVDKNGANSSVAPSNISEVVLMDMDTGESKLVGSNPLKSDTKTPDKPEERSESSTEAPSSKEQQNPELEDEMLSLLNLFLSNSEQKKDDSTPVSKPDSQNILGNKDDVIELQEVHLLPNSADVLKRVSVVGQEGLGTSQVVSAPADLVLPTDNTVFQNTDIKDTQVVINIDGQMHIMYLNSNENANSGQVLETMAVKSTDDQNQSEIDSDNATVEVSFRDQPTAEGTDPEEDAWLFDTSVGQAAVAGKSTLAVKPVLGPTSTETSGSKKPDDLLVISESGWLCCLKCPYKTDKKVNWYKHKLKHKERQYQCPQCSYRASTSSNMKRHLSVHSGARNYHCAVCDAKFNQKIHLARHIKYKHEKRTFQCTYCDYVCVRLQPDLVSHVKKKHSDICTVNKDGTIQSNNVSDILMKHKCEQCNVYTVSKKDLQQHMKFHKRGAELKFFCEMCSFVTECESRLKRHILTHTKEKPFMCGLCTYRANEAEHVKRHLKTKHHIQAPSVKRSKSQTPATADANKDDGSSDSAEKSFLLDGNAPHKPKYALSDARSSEKHFACNFCTMKFSKLINLFKHVHGQHKQVMVTQDNVHNCVVCDFSTSCYKRLLVHMRRMHSTSGSMNTPQKQVYVCMLCSYSSPYRLYLHAHLKKEHNMHMVSDKEGVNKYMLDASKHSSMIVQAVEESDPKKPGSIIKRGSEPEPEVPPKDSKMVLVQLTPDGPMTPVFISMGENDPGSSSLLNGTDPENEYPIMETGIMDGTPMTLESCEDHDLGQVLKEVAMVPLPASATTTSSLTTSSSQIPAKTENQTRFSQMIPHMKSIPSTITSSTVKVESPPSIQLEVVPNVSEETNVNDDDEDIGEEGKPGEEEPKEVDSEEVVHLSSGDFVEINGQIYKIEMESMEDRGEPSTDKSDGIVTIHEGENVESSSDDP